jgi:4-amino-4-deoxy-L-arabinose transferase-like glycosyltransferase
VAPLTRGVWLVAGLVAVVLTAVSPFYGWERDELYFASLPPAWGYVDQPPLVPLLAHTLVHWLGGGVVLVRIPATICAAASVVLLGLLVRELGGDRRSQVFAAVAYAGTSACLDFGHVFLTSTPDLVVWPLVCWLVVRAELRSRPRLWLWAGLVAGLGGYVKLLVVVLLAGIVVGLLVAGPRERLRSAYVWGGGLVALVVTLPNVVYQLNHDLPQLRMGAALSEHNAGEVRWFMWVFLVIVLGPPLVWVWGRGLVELWRRPEWRPVRFLVPAFAVVLLFTLVGGSQPHYPTFMLLVLFAAGCAAGVRLAWPWLVLNTAVSAVISLPLLPLSVLGDTPVPDINLLAADSVGWQTYVDQVEAAYAALPAAERDRTVVVTSNYGEAGALLVLGQDLPGVYSGHNALGDLDPPPASATAVMFVGGQVGAVRRFFASCEVVDRLDNGVDVDNEEQGQPLSFCRDRSRSWAGIWAELRHLD